MFLQAGDEVREAGDPNPWSSAWEIVRLLGTGRHCRVYEVRSLAPELEGQRAALKLARYDPRRCHLNDYVEAQRRRLRREAETLAHFSPRLPDPIDLFECVNRQDPFEGFGAERVRQSEPALVQTLIQGASLADLMELRGAPPAPAERLLLAVARVAGFLDELHAGGNGWLFWALTPEHILVDPELAFEPSFVGCANLRPLRRGLAVPEPWEASERPEPGYAAPEALAGGPCGPGVDVYALGALLFHLFTGLDPRDLAAEDPAAQHATLERLCRRNLKGLGLHRSRVRRLLLRCLEPDPDARFASPLEVRDELLECARRAMPVAWSGGPSGA